MFVISCQFNKHFKDIGKLKNSQGKPHNSSYPNLELFNGSALNFCLTLGYTHHCLFFVQIFNIFQSICCLKGMKHCRRKQKQQLLVYLSKMSPTDHKLKVCVRCNAIHIMLCYKKINYTTWFQTPIDYLQILRSYHSFPSWSGPILMVTQRHLFQIQMMIWTPSTLKVRMDLANVHNLDMNNYSPIFFNFQYFHFKYFQVLCQLLSNFRCSLCSDI